MEKHTVTCINETQDLTDIESLAEVIDHRHLGRHYKTLEQRVDVLIDWLKTELFFLIKNAHHKPVWYVMMEKNINKNKHWLYTLFVLPWLRNQWAGRSALEYLIAHYGSTKDIHVEVYDQETYTLNYSEWQIDWMWKPAIERERLIKLLETCGFVLSDKKYWSFLVASYTHHIIK